MVNSYHIAASIRALMLSLKRPHKLTDRDKRTIIHLHNNNEAKSAAVVAKEFEMFLELVGSER